MELDPIQKAALRDLNRKIEGRDSQYTKTMEREITIYQLAATYHLTNVLQRTLDALTKTSPCKEEDDTGLAATDEA